MGTWSHIADSGTFAECTASSDSLRWGTAEIGGHPVVLVWCDFDVLAGTLSRSAGAEFTAALDLAIERGTPVVGIAQSGGARMQEGTSAFVQMVAATAAVARLRRAGLPLITYLAHPTTGGVLGSWATSGDVVLAEPGATIAFTGPRVAAALGTPIEPPEVQTADGQMASGQLDALVERDELGAALASALDVLGTSHESGLSGPGPDDRGEPSEPGYAVAANPPRGWDSVVASRSTARNDPLDAFLMAADSSIELRGDRHGSDDPAVATLLCRFAGRRVLLVGHRRGEDGGAATPSASGLRKTLRALEVAERCGFGLITVIDTAGAKISGQGESEGMARLVSASLHALVGFNGTSVSVLAGQGSGGIALALYPSDACVAVSDSWMSAISPEAASLILHRTTEAAHDLADAQGVSAAELAESGIVDQVVEADSMVPAALAAFDAAMLDSASLHRSGDRMTRRMARFAHIAQGESEREREDT